jgi:hypothetical protein
MPSVVPRRRGSTWRSDAPNREVVGANVSLDAEPIRTCRLAKSVTDHEMAISRLKAITLKTARNQHDNWKAI